MTLRELAGRAGVTESFLSQVEREVTSPSIASVQRIARALDLAIAELFTEEAPHGRVVRRSERRRIVYPGLQAVDEFLTAGMSGRLQVILSTIEPGGGTGDEPYTHDSDEEVVIVLSGQLELWVAMSGTFSKRATRSPTPRGCPIATSTTPIGRRRSSSA